MDWFKKRQKDRDCVHFCAFDAEDRPIGQIRFDLKGSDADVDVNIDRGMRNQGYGSALIRAGVEKVTRGYKPRNIYARVKAENRASIQSFQKAGFIIDGEEGANGSGVVRLRWGGPGNRGQGQ